MLFRDTAVVIGEEINGVEPLIAATKQTAQPKGNHALREQSNINARRVASADVALEKVGQLKSINPSRKVWTVAQKTEDSLVKDVRQPQILEELLQHLSSRKVSVEKERERESSSSYASFYTAEGTPCGSPPTDSEGTPCVSPPPDTEGTPCVSPPPDTEGTPCGRPPPDTGGSSDLFEDTIVCSSHEVLTTYCTTDCCWTEERVRDKTIQDQWEFRNRSTTQTANSLASNPSRNYSGRISHRSDGTNAMGQMFDEGYRYGGAGGGWDVHTTGYSGDYSSSSRETGVTRTVSTRQDGEGGGTMVTTEIIYEDMEERCETVVIYTDTIIEEELEVMGSEEFVLEGGQYELGVIGGNHDELRVMEGDHGELGVIGGDHDERDTLAGDRYQRDYKQVFKCFYPICCIVIPC